MTTSVTSQQALAVVVSLHRLLRSLRHAVRETGLQPTQLVVLSLLVENGPMRIGEVAARVPCSQPTATTVVSSLEADGLASRAPDPADGRATRVVLTDAGRDMIMSVAHGEAELLSERMAHLSPAEQAQVLAVTPLLRQLAEPTES